MDIRLIKLIVAIVDHGSISAAAETLHLTQSALSHQLKEMESQTGVLLFTRANRRLNITPAGQMIYESAKKIMSEVNRLELQIKNLNSLKEGRIRLSASCTTSYHWLPKILKAFNKDFPNVHVDIMIDSDGDPIQKVKESKIDLAIVNAENEEEGIDYHYLFETEVVAVVSHQHPFNRKKFLIAKDFKEEHLIIHSYPLDSVVFYREALKPKGIMPKKISALPLTEATLELIQADYGIAVMSKWSIKPYLDSKLVNCKRINPKGLYRKHYAVQASGVQYPSYMAAFIDYLQKGEW